MNLPDIPIYLEFAILVSAVWYMAIILVDEDGPFDILYKFRKFMGVDFKSDGGWYGRTIFGRILICKLCTSFWISIIVSALYYLFGEVVVWLAFPFSVAGLAILIELRR